MGALEQIKKWRRQLHQIPEIGLQEYQTSNYLKKELIEMGYDPISILDTGILVYIDHHQDKTVAFRSDMDGLKISEQTNCDFKSIYMLVSAGLLGSNLAKSSFIYDI